VVVAPDHPLNNLLELHPDETANAAARRPGDVSATLDWWLETGAAELGVGVREDAIGVAGHSFGALTSLVVGGGRWDVDTLEAHCDNEGGTVCNFIEGQVVDRDLVASQGQPDPRVRATVALAPGGWYVFGEGGLDEVAAPLMLAGTRDVDLPYEREARPTWEATAGATLGTLADAGHWAFSDMCALLPLEDCAGASGGFMEPARVVEITTSRATAHFRVHLLGDVDAEPWLAGDVDLSWEIR
jgi:predicted dienelactone hydrolase